MGNRRRTQTKRKHAPIKSMECEDDLQCEDDLSHAAQFAILPSTPFNVEMPGKSDSIEENNEDLQDMETDERSSATALNENSDIANNNMENNDDGGKEEDSDDDGDLAEILQKMEDHDVAAEEEEANRLVIPSNDTAHQTKNEVDGYKTSIREVESRLQIQLSVGENVVATTTNVSLAGRIKNHMVQDRTLVVESISHSPASPLASKPLDVGSLLVLKKPCDDKKDPNASWIPLGRIFEVFGPVSQPLYTIRLPPPGPIADQKSSDDSKETNDTPLEEDSTGNSVVAEDPAVPRNTSPEKSPEIMDPWAEGGECTKFLAQSQDMEVYYVQDEAKLIDTSLVLKTSAKGCDASNMHDEEILEPQEEYYSDDEKETKQRKKNNPRKRRNNRPRSKHNHHQNTHAPTMTRHQFHHIPQGMHPRPPPPPPPRHGNIPPPSTLYQYPAQSLHYRQGGPMPPHSAHPPYRSNPNLPNINPDEPPPYQY